jgi:HEPN domain-containing protein
MRYTYSFVTWPDEQTAKGRSLYALFRVLSERVEIDFTPEEFAAFRAELQEHYHLTLREIERVPYVEPETVL